jgi:hypothetical protein
MAATALNRITADLTKENDNSVSNTLLADCCSGREVAVLKKVVVIVSMALALVVPAASPALAADECVWILSWAQCF